MPMPPRVRKLALTAHVTFSVGWLGALVAYLALAYNGWTAQDRAAFQSMELVGWVVILPLSLAAFVTGLVQSLGTEWGLFRHYWVVAKLALTIVAVTVLLLHLPTISRVSGMARDATLSLADFGGLQKQLLLHAGGGLVVLLTITFLSVFKPWGRTPVASRVPWRLLIALGIAALVIVLVAVHVFGGGMHHS